MSAKLLDRVLETPIAPSFTRIGAVVRSRTEHWTDLDDYDLTGRTILLTGATSGLGLAAAHRLAGLGATLLVVGRNPAKTDAACAALPSPTGATHTPLYADLGGRVSYVVEPERFNNCGYELHRLSSAA